MYRHRYTQRELAEVLSKSNRLLITDTRKLLDTSLISGTHYFLSDQVAESYFSGFVFRGDTRTPEDIFYSGFVNQTPLTNEDQVLRMAGGIGWGYTYTYGVSTAISLPVCQQYIERIHRKPFHIDKRYNTGCIYLIDAMHLSGFAIRHPFEDGEFVQTFPTTRGLYEVNFMHGIPNTSIVGVLFQHLGRRNVLKRIWPFIPESFPPNYVYDLRSVYLAVNPEYEGGAEGAQRAGSTHQIRTIVPSNSSSFLLSQPAA